MGAILKMKECDTMRILVVEDDRLLNNTLCYNLNTAGYTVDSALTKSVAIARNNPYIWIFPEVASCR